MTIYTDLYLLRAANALALTICHLAEAAETNEAAQMLLDESLELQKQLANVRDEVEGILTTNGKSKHGAWTRNTRESQRKSNKPHWRAS